MSMARLPLPIWLVNNVQPLLGERAGGEGLTSIRP